VIAAGLTCFDLDVDLAARQRIGGFETRPLYLEQVVLVGELAVLDPQSDTARKSPQSIQHAFGVRPQFRLDGHKVAAGSDFRRRELGNTDHVLGELELGRGIGRRIFRMEDGRPQSSPDREHLIGFGLHAKRPLQRLDLFRMIGRDVLCLGVVLAEIMEFP
jgi:hypothetical protein